MQRTLQGVPMSQCTDSVNIARFGDLSLFERAAWLSRREMANPLQLHAGSCSSWLRYTQRQQCCCPMTLHGVTSAKQNCGSAAWQWKYCSIQRLKVKFFKHWCDSEPIKLSLRSYRSPMKMHLEARLSKYPAYLLTKQEEIW